MCIKKTNTDKRRVVVFVFILFGLLVVFYLGGLLGQLNWNYRNWLANDGLSGHADMETISFGLLHCIVFAFTSDGRNGLIFILLISIGLMLFLKFQDRFGSNNFDERNFSKSSRGTYGTAGWMSEKEANQVLEITQIKNAKGIILGKNKKEVICLPENTRLNKHIAIFGASGTMKSRGIIRPYLFQSIKRGESVIITDPKAEMYNDTSELFRQNGYDVKVFNLINPEHSNSWNCMMDLHGDTLMAQLLADVIIANTRNGSNGDHFWDNGEGNLLKALVLYVDSDISRGPEGKNLPAVYQLLTNNSEKQLTAMFDRLPMEHPAKAPYNLFKQSSDTVRAGIILGLGTRLQVLQNEAVRQITRYADIDLTEPGKKKCAYFVILSDQEGSLDFLSSLFFSFLFIKLVRYADSRKTGICKVPVNIVFEEFNNIGVIPDFARKLSTIRARHLQVIMAVQNLGQLQNRYPDNLWAELLGNTDTQLMLGCTDELTAEYFSMRSGDMTVEINSVMTVRQTIALTQMIPQYRYTEGEGKRKLLTIDEVLRIPHDELLIVIRGQKMLRAKKIDYTEHPYSKQLKSSFINEYNVDYSIQNMYSHETENEVNEPAQIMHRKTKKSLYSSAKPPDDF